MKKLTKTLTIEKALELSKRDTFLKKLVSLFPNYTGINICSIQDITFKCTDDEYGQLTDIHMTFKPVEEESIYTNSKIAWIPWLKRSEDKSKVEYNVTE